MGGGPVDLGGAGSGDLRVWGGTTTWMLTGGGTVYCRETGWAGAGRGGRGGGGKFVGVNVGGGRLGLNTAGGG